MEIDISEPQQVEVSSAAPWTGIVGASSSIWRALGRELWKCCKVKCVL